MTNRTDILSRKDEILQWISEKKPKAYICRQLHCKPITLETYLEKLGIQYSGNQGSRGSPRTKKSVEEYLKSSCIKSHLLKQKLIHFGIKEHRCELCGLSEWLGNPIPIELDHIDGNHYNNSLDNLQIVCPNCHATLPTNSGKNRGRYTKNADVAKSG